jgi:hypothetical protein
MRTKTHSFEGEVKSREGGKVGRLRGVLGGGRGSYVDDDKEGGQQ